MKRTSIIRLIIYSLAIVIPILAMVNCTGWGTNDMKVDHCYIDTPILRELSQNCYGILFFSCFLFGIPIALYAGVVLLIVEGPLFLISRIRKREYKNTEKSITSNKQPSPKNDKVSPFVIIPFAALALVALYIIASL